MRANVAGLITDPRPFFAARNPTGASRRALFEACVSAGLIAADTPFTGLFPPNSDAARAPQPFWSAAGSGNGSHHAYPGGLPSVHAMHVVRAELARHDGDAWYANTVLARRSAIALYQTLGAGGRTAFDRKVASIVATPGG